MPMPPNENDARTPSAHEPLLLPDRQAAALCGSSRASWHRWRASGRIPPAIRLGRKLLWSRETLVEWVRAGCPDALTWAAIQAAAARRRMR
jgi:predicted DNA-binding transcriptional regulator AlpA